MMYKNSKRPKKRLAFRFTAILMALIYLFIAQLVPAWVAAEPLPDSEIKALRHYPNWVGLCGSDISAAEAPSGDDDVINDDGASDPDKATPDYDYIARGSIPKKGLTVNATYFGGSYSDSKKSWIIQNKYQYDLIKKGKKKESDYDAKLGDPGDDNGLGGHNDPSDGKTVIAEIGNGNSLGGLPDGTKLEISYKGKTIIAEKNQIGGGAPGAKIDLWWETARLLDFKNGYDKVKIHVVPDNTPVTPVGGEAGEETDTPAAAAAALCCPTEDSGGGDIDAPTSKDLEKNLKVIFDEFIKAGYSKEQAAGVVGNVVAESSGSPTRYEGGTDTKSPPGSSGWGIVQWTPASKMVDYAKKVNKPAYELATQIEFLLKQLDGTSPANQEKAAGDALKKAKTAEEAAETFMREYERPGVLATEKRKASAKHYLSKFGPSAPDSGGGSDSVPSDQVECCPPGESGEETGDTAPSDWKKMYTGSNKSKVAHMAHGDLKDPKVLLIHYTVGSQEGQELLNFFSGEETGIQFNVGKTGKIYQYYPLEDMKMTYHAKGVNSKAIGIEITGKDVNELMEHEEQFKSVVKLAKFLCDKYKIPCGEPKGDITGDGADAAQGMLGHDETPTNDHSDPDATAAQATSGGLDRKDSSKHPYMKKLREAMGFDPTPGKKGGDKGGGGAESVDAGDTANCEGTAADSQDGNGTKKDPVGAGKNRALALEAVKYDTKSNNGKYTYEMGGLHGPVSQLEKFAKSGGVADCSGFVRYIIWRVYGKDVGSFTTQALPGNSNFREVDKDDVQAGDIGWNTGHVDFITQNKDGKLHQFGAHSTATDIHGGDADLKSYQKYFRYIGPKTNANVSGEVDDL